MHRFGWAALVCAAALAALLWLPAGPPTAPASSDAGEAIVYVDLSRLTLTLYIDRRQAGRWPIAGGSPASPSPIGTWHINAKIRGAGTVFGTRWLGLDCPWGSYGIHGTDAPGSIGGKVSGGCIRMLNKDVEKLYAKLPLGAAVVIEDGAMPPGRLPALRPGDRGGAVMAVQRRLRALMYFDGTPDGIFGPRTAAALYAFKLDEGLKQGTGVDAATYRALGLLPFE